MTCIRANYVGNETFFVGKLDLVNTGISNVKAWQPTVSGRYIVVHRF